MTDIRNIVGLIGGTGLDDWGFVTARQGFETPYGSPSSEISVFESDTTRLQFLPRHGYSHCIPPHRVNSRANLWALRNAGVDRVIAVNAVGGISPDFAPGALCVPDQLIDYTWGRVHTFSDDLDHSLKHVEFAHPFTGPLREALLSSAVNAGVPVLESACIGVTQGPRLETAAEVRRLKTDGCDIVGMTSMPEAALARELEMDYASISVVSNWAAGITDEPITMETVMATLEVAVSGARELIRAYLNELDAI
jgi:5'-deoxy-5'-methylthioadenosine phosphorylase